MALVSTGFTLTVQLKDSTDDVSNLKYQLVAADAAAAATAAADIMTRLALMTDSVVSGYSMTESFTENAFAYPADAQNEMRAAVVCRLAGFANKTVTVYIPAPKDALFVSPTGPSAKDVDPTQTDLISYIDIWRTTGALAEISDGEFIADTASIVNGKRTHRASSYG